MRWLPGARTGQGMTRTTWPSPHGGGEVGGQVIVQGPGIERVIGAEGAEDVLLGMAAGVEGNCFVRPQLGK